MTLLDLLEKLALTVLWRKAEAGSRLRRVRIYGRGWGSGGRVGGQDHRLDRAKLEGWRSLPRCLTNWMADC